MNVDQMEKATGAAKNSVQLLFSLGFALLLIVLIFSSNSRKGVGKFLDDLGVESAEGAGLKINRKLADNYKAVVTENVDLKRRLASSAVPPSKASPPDVTPPSAQASILSQIDEGGSAWVYIGPFSNGTSLSKPNFDVKTEPASGTEMKALNDTYKRAGEPYEAQKEDWRLGRITGVVKAGETVKVIRVSRIPGDNNSVNLWAEVSQAGK